MPGRLELVRKISRAVGDTPPLRSLRGRYYERQFVRRPGTFSGIFRSFLEATEAAPPNSKQGYDHAELAELYADRHFKVLPSDYPALFWLDRILRSATSVFDFGGHLGIQYYSYGKYLTYPADLRWTVLDVPSIVKRGQALAAERGQTQPSFTLDFGRVADHEVFFASGSLQYVETPLAERLTALTALPRHLLINKLPLREGEPFVTLQNVQFSFCPYAVSNRSAINEPLKSLGYELMDAWETPDMFCELPLDPDFSISAYTGLYLRLPEGSSARAPS